MTDKAQAQAQYTIGDGEAAVVKTGTANTTDGTVTWTIKVHMHNQKSVRIQDIPGNGIINDINAVVSVTGTDGTEREITLGDLTQKGSEADYGYTLTTSQSDVTYTLKYTTKINMAGYKILSQLTCSNTAVAVFGNWTASDKAEVGYGKEYKNRDIISKSGAADGKVIN